MSSLHSLKRRVCPCSFSIEDDKHLEANYHHFGFTHMDAEKGKLGQTHNAVCSCMHIKLYENICVCVVVGGHVIWQLTVGATFWPNFEISSITLNFHTHKLTHSPILTHANNGATIYYANEVWDFQLGYTYIVITSL